MSRKVIGVIVTYIIVAVILILSFILFKNPERFDDALGKNPIDAFEQVEVVIQGNEPEATLTIIDKRQVEIAEIVSIEADKTSGISNGDEITIKASAKREELKKLGITLRNKTLSYKVEDAGVILDTNKIPPKKQMDAIINSFTEKIQQDINDNALFLQNLALVEGFEGVSSVSYIDSSIRTAYVLSEDNSDEWFASESTKFFVIIFDVTVEVDGEQKIIGMAYRETDVEVGNDLEVKYNPYSEDYSYDISAQSDDLVRQFVLDASDEFIKLKIYE